MDIKVRQFMVSEWDIYKSLRLASLGESFDSFASTFEREAAFTDNEWKAKLSPRNDAVKFLPLLGMYKGNAVGLAWGVLHDKESQNAHIYQMWVSPEHRGLGIGRALVEQIIAWARKLGLNALILAVTITNTEAVSLYTSCGFLPYSKTEPLREGSNLLVQPMILKIG